VDENERVYAMHAVQRTKQSDAGLDHDGMKKGRDNMVAAEQSLRNWTKKGRVPFRRPEEGRG
jgi:hypothetical protein